MSRKIKIILFVISLLCLGFFREYLFVNINGILYNKFFGPNGNNLHSIPAIFNFLSPVTYQTLYISKWFITPLFAFFFWLLQKKFLDFLFHEKKTTRWLTVLYLSLLLLAGISLCTG